MQVTAGAGQAPAHCPPWDHRILEPQDPWGTALLPQTNSAEFAAEVLQSERFSHREAAIGDA